MPRYFEKYRKGTGTMKIYRQRYVNIGRALANERKANERRLKVEKVFKDLLDTSYLPQEKRKETKVLIVSSGDFGEKRRRVLGLLEANKEIQRFVMSDEKELQVVNLSEYGTIGIDLSKGNDTSHIYFNPKVTIIDDPMEAREVDVKILEPMEPSISVKRKVSLIGRFTKWIRGLFEGIA